MKIRFTHSTPDTTTLTIEDAEKDSNGRYTNCEEKHRQLICLYHHILSSEALVENTVLHDCLFRLTTQEEKLFFHFDITADGTMSQTPSLIHRAYRYLSAPCRDIQLEQFKFSEFTGTLILYEDNEKHIIDIMTINAADLQSHKESPWNVLQLPTTERKKIFFIEKISEETECLQIKINEINHPNEQEGLQSNG